MLLLIRLICFVLAFRVLPCAYAISETSNATLPDLYEASIAELQDGLQKGLFTSVDLVMVSYPKNINHTEANRTPYIGLLCQD